MIIDFAVIASLALLAWRLTKVHKLCQQYPWRYERGSLLTAHRRDEAAASGR
jgi:hypothetical protein